jgi:hypothetical protein
MARCEYVGTSGPPWLEGMRAEAWPWRKSKVKNSYGRQRSRSDIREA